MAAPWKTGRQSLPAFCSAPAPATPGFTGFLCALALIYFSAFFSLLFQIRGLIGRRGILPARIYLQEVAKALGPWQESPIVLQTEEQLLENDPDVLRLFAGNPFAGKPPLEVRAVLWQYWFTDPATKRATGDWWRRELSGLYAPVLERAPGGRFEVLQMPRVLIRRQ